MTRPSRLAAPLRGVACVVLFAWLAGCATAPADAPPSAPASVAGLPQPSRTYLDATAGATAPQAVGRQRIHANVDPDDGASRTDLWVRVRRGFAIPDLDNDLVRKWEQWYGSRPDYVQRMTERGGRYLFYVMEELDRRGMPSDLALLPFIESAFNPQAMSVAAASGMWQFMPATGRDFELKQNIFRDDRRDVLASTRAALDYLQVLNRQFNDWQLALAAYNWGQGNVQKAIDRNTKAGLPTDYESLRMPDETRNYVPKLQAVKNIVLEPQRFALTLPPLQNHPYFLSVAIERDIDVDVAVRLAGLPLEEFQQLNPQMNKPVILAAGTPRVLLPYDNANQFLRNVGSHQGALATWTAWTAPRTLKPAEAAQLVGMSEERLREVNRIPARMLVKQGSTLLVPRSDARAADVSVHVADHAMMALAPDLPPLKRVSFKAGRKGDSVTAVALRYRVSAEQVAAWNEVGAKAAFKPGQTVVVMVPNKPARVVAKSAPGKRPAAKPAGSVRVASVH